MEDNIYTRRLAAALPKETKRAAYLSEMRTRHVKAAEAWRAALRWRLSEAMRRAAALSYVGLLAGIAGGAMKKRKISQ